MLKTVQWNVIIIIIIIIIVIIIIIIIIIIDVIVVVNDDTYYWVYWSSDHPFQVYCKVRPLLYYKVRQVLIEYKMQQVSQSATEQGLQISSHDLGREGSRKARHAIKTGTASIGFFPDLFVHNYWNISHQTQSLHLSNTILKCL